MNILILGIQGSGKGTQAKLLSEHLKIPHISSGDIFRSLDTNTATGKKVKTLIDKGQLVPDDLTIQLVKQRLLKRDCENGAILDGFPRNEAQAKQLEQFLKIDYVLLLEISDHEAVKRLTGRRTCSNKKCGIIYNTYTMPKPQVDTICDKCKSKLYQRADDTKKAVEKRIQTYHKQTEPLVNFYKTKEILIPIKAKQPIRDIHEQIKLKLKRKQQKVI